MARCTLACLAVFLCSIASSIAQEMPSKSRPETPGPSPTRRDRIDSQLDGNSRWAEQLYRLLDGIEQDDIESSRTLEQHLDVIDQHNEVLYEELETLDRQQYINDRRADRLLQIQSLRSHADQLRRQNRNVEAAGLEAKATQLQGALDDGSWLRRAEQKWSCDVKDDGASPDVQSLRDEVAVLREETSRLREEVRGLRDLVQQLVRELRTNK